MKDRIQKYMDQSGISAGELSQLLDVQRSNISHILNGRNKPSAAFIEKMLTVFPDLNARWLLTGQGEMMTNVKAHIPKVTTAQNIVSTGEDLDHKESSQKTVQKKKTVKSKVEKEDIQMYDDEIDKVLLLFRDGSFKTYKKR